MTSIKIKKNDTSLNNPDHLYREKILHKLNLLSEYEGNLLEIYKDRETELLLFAINNDVSPKKQIKKICKCAIDNKDFELISILCDNLELTKYIIDYNRKMRGYDTVHSEIEIKIRELIITRLFVSPQLGSSYYGYI